MASRQLRIKYFGSIRSVFDYNQGSISQRWLVGMAFVVTPAVALVQGAWLLQNYRNHHREMPYPNSPSEGLVVSVDERNHDMTAQEAAAKFLRLKRKVPPLRLLVIGDSLAAGVGVERRATPVLPESIARSLSQSMGGRPVHWTCIGRPGNSLREIIRDIEMHDQMLLLARRQTGATATATATSTIFNSQIAFLENLRQRKARLLQWWQERAQGIEVEEKLKSKRSILKWWGEVREHVRSFRKAWIGTANHMSHEGRSYAEEEEDDDISDDRRQSPDTFTLWQQWKRRLQRRESLKGDIAIVGQYDIAVVLAGGNDIKHAWLPFMFKRDQDNLSDGETAQERLQAVVRALQSRMKRALDKKAVEHNCDTVSLDDMRMAEEPLTDSTRRPSPLVVFPAIPVTWVPLLNFPPLGWFLFYVFRRLDNYKKAMALKFPGEVMFVESPPVELIANIKAKKGKFYEDLKAEEVLLKLTNVTQRVQENFEKKLKEYQDKLTKLMTEDREHAKSETDEEACSCSYQGEVYLTLKDQNAVAQGQATNETRPLMLSLDQLHPNDEGYDIWGRHIASEILKQWNKKTSQ